MNPVSTMFWVGIDVSKDKVDAAICHETKAHADPRHMPVRQFPLGIKGIRDLVRWIAAEEGRCAGLCAESTGVYSRRLEKLLASARNRPEELPRLSIANPLHIKGTARSLGLRDKSDEIDARVIAIHGAQRRPQPAIERAPCYEKLRALFHLRESYLQRRTACQNQLEACLDKDCRVLFKQDLAHMERQIRKVEESIREHIDSEGELKKAYDLMTSIPGVGPVVALMVMAEFGDITAWSRKQVVAFAGLYPREHTSGKSVRGTPRLAKGGGGLIRKVLYMPALQLLKREYEYNATVRRQLEENKREPMVCIGIGMRKLLLVIRAVAKSGMPYDPAKAA